MEEESQPSPSVYEKLLIFFEKGTSQIMTSEEKEVQNPKVFLGALGQFCFSSVGMMIGNKMGMEFLKDPETGAALPSTFVALQIVGTLLLLTQFQNKIEKDKLNLECARSWAPVFTLFAGMLYTSAKTFQYVHVSFVIIVRNVGAIITTFVEYLVRGTSVNAEIIFSEIIIVIGTVMYGYEGLKAFKDFWTGMQWCLLNVLCQTLYGVTLKYKMENDEDIKDMSKYTMSLFNNLLCLPYLIIVALAAGEPNHYGEILPKVPPHGWLLILVTCAIGFMISTSGFGLQKLVSATSFLVINNMTKILNIILGVVFLGDHLPSFFAFLGCFVSLGGGFWYSFEVMALNEKKKRERIDAERRDVEASIPEPEKLIERRAG
eukprot:TRINITY_DN9489_c0_g1_i4.p1 TRINITY_DN9489_c0_g1~~TRINITY_DN9489_c0_g1_i4.p1  ORF type:complete len:375 (+),score=56.38 TRINITY_DN9489_c0_g1_i4:43-1167(+)